MLEAFKRLISRTPAGPDWSDVAEWAQKQRLGFRRQHEGAGFVIDGAVEGKPWRLEWGPPQRHYIEGQELRMRIELGLPASLQMLLIAQPLSETLERQTFERFTESTQTLADADTPEEMRWLAMFPKATYQASKEVRMRFVVVGNVPDEAVAWIEGALARQMEQIARGALQHEPPFLVMVLRGRVYLRMELPEPDVQEIAEALGLFQVAVLQAMRVANAGSDGSSGWASTGSTAWQTQLDPLDPKRR